MVEAYRLIDGSGWSSHWHTDDAFVDWLVAAAASREGYTVESQEFDSIEAVQHANQE